NILGAIVSGQAVRLLVDLALSPRRPLYFGTGQVIERGAVREAMGRVTAWDPQPTAPAPAGLAATPRGTIYPPPAAQRRASPRAAAPRVEVPDGGAGPGPGPGPAPLAPPWPPHTLGLAPPASCRLSFSLSTPPAEIDQAIAAVAAIATGHHQPTTPWYRRLTKT